MLIIGVWTSRYIHSFVDFALAGRKLTAPLLVGTLVATYYGLDVTFGSSETAFLEGISTFFVYSFPFYVAYIAVALAIAPRLANLPVKSLPETCAYFYGHGVRLPATFATTIYSLPILSIAGLGLVGHVFFELDPVIAGLIGASIAATYTLLGGLLADTLTDTIQFLAMCLTLSCAALIGMMNIGSIESIQSSMNPMIFEPLGSLSLTDIVIYSTVALSPLVDPAFYQRIFAAESAKTIKRALLLSTIFWIAFDWAVIYLGIIGKYMVDQGLLLQTIDETEVLLHVTTYLLPSGLLGLFVAGIIATAMSTVDSYALIAASSVVYDGWHAFRENGLTERQLILFTRIGIVLMVVLALILSYRFERFRDGWIFMASILVSSVFVPLIAGLFCQHRGRRSGTWSCWTGFLSAAGLFLLFEIFGTYHGHLETQILAIPRYDLFFQREHLLLVTLPLCVCAFGLGYVFDRIAKSNGIEPKRID